MFRAIVVFILGSIALGYFGACSPVEFSHKDSATCQGTEAECVKTCNDGTCKDQFVTEETVGRGMVDIIFVDDNSGSMSTEQKKMADRFPTFLKSISDLDYRVGIITTDISSTYAKSPTSVKNPPAPINDNGALQDGSPINFPSGKNILDPSLGSFTTLQDWFGKTISRPETKTCEDSKFTNCPSGDERGIYALNLLLDRYGSTFFREGADVAAIILSDEDERSLSDSRSVRTTPDSAKTEDQWLLSQYKLESYDKPETLISRFKKQFPGKNLTGHSIIVKPGDTACRDKQTGQGNNSYVRGVEGFTYDKFSKLTGGVVGSICDDDYGKNLSDIGAHLVIPTVKMVCRPDSEADVKVELSGDGANARFKINLETLVVEFPDSLPPLTKIKVSYSCPTIR